MSCSSSVSAPSTPTEQIKQHPNVSTKKKAKQNNRVHFPDDEMLVSCFLEPPDPWSKVYGNTLNTLITAYVATCDKQGIKPLASVLDQLQEYESCSYKLESNPRAFDLSILGEKLSFKHCEALEEVLRRLQFNLVDLEGCYLEDEGAAAFFDMVEYYDSAVQLNISFTKHIDCRGWQACSRMLKKIISKIAPLAVIYYPTNDIVQKNLRIEQFQGVALFNKTTSLVHLNARSTGLNEQVLLIVGRALRLGSNLVTLHLENCGIFGRCLVILVAALKLNTTLRELFLAENKISPADGFQLGNLLRTNTHLELLDLSNNKLGDDGLVHVMESLGQQSNTLGRGLSTLTLWNNDLTVKGIPFISRALTAARALRRLNLGSNAISSAGILEMKQSLICNRTIEILELENAQITSEGASALADYISQNPFIQKLDIRGNDVRLDGLKMLSQAMENNVNIISLKIDPTSMDLSEPLKDRQSELQEINKCCQRNKEAKSSLPPQDAQLSTLFNGIFSHVLPTPVASEVAPNIDKMVPNSVSSNSLKGRFRVSVVVLNQENIDNSKSTSQTSRSMSLDTGYISVPSGYKKEMFDSQLPSIPVTEPAKNKSVDTLVSSRIKWLQDLHISDVNTTEQKKCFESPLVEAEPELLHNHVLENEVFLQSDEVQLKDLKDKKIAGLTLPLQNTTEPSETEQKVRRLSSPTISSVPSLSRKTHSIKCCKELEGLDLRSTVPLSPTRLHESFDYPESDVSEVPLNSQMNIKSSHTVYMVH